MIEKRDGRLVTIFGGSGFVGRHVVRALARRGWRVRVACRRPDLAGHLQPLGGVGQITAVQANLRFPQSVLAAVRGADAVINLVGILMPSGAQNFAAVQEFGARIVGKAAAEEGITNLVHVSAIGADAQSESDYARTKGLGEAAIREAVPTAIVMRPSVVFGPEDEFFNRFAGLARVLPVLPLIGAETKLQPVFVGDVAEAIARALEGGATQGATYELGGPEVKTLREIMAYVCAVTGRKRLLLPLPPPAANAMAWTTEIANMLSLGLMPKSLVTTRDQVKLLGRDNLVSADAASEKRTLEGLGVRPTTIEAIVPSYLYRYRKSGQFSRA